MSARTGCGTLTSARILLDFVVFLRSIADFDEADDFMERVAYAADGDESDGALSNVSGGGM